MMATITVSGEELKKFVKEYKELPNVHCKECGNELNKKEVSPATFVIMKKLRERYY